MSILDELDPEQRQKLERAVVLIPPRDLGGCWVAVVAELARRAGVTLPDCTDPECDHPKVPNGFGTWWKPGMYLAQAVREVEESVASDDAN